MSLIEDVRDRALSRPWLLAPPLLGVGAKAVLDTLPFPGAGFASVAVRAGLGALMTVAVTAAFAELWLGDGTKIDAGRFVETGTVYLLPYPLLLLVGAATTPLAFMVLQSGAPEATAYAVLFGLVGVGKLCAFAFGAASSLGAARRVEASGAFSAVVLGFRALAANAAFLLPLLLAAWLLQEASVFGLRAAGLGRLTGLVATAIPLLACVAAPLEAWRTGRLKKT